MVLSPVPSPSPSIVSDYVGWVKVRAARYLPVTDPDYDDLVQEGLIGAWQSLTSYDPTRGSLPYWITFKANGRMLDAVQRRKASHHKQGRGYTQQYDPIEVLPCVVDTRRFVRTCLTSTQRRYVFLRFYCGYDSRDLTEAFGYFPGAILGQVKKKWQYIVQSKKERGIS